MKKDRMNFFIAMAMLTAILLLSACNNQLEYYPSAEDYASNEGVEITAEITSEPEEYQAIALDGEATDKEEAIYTDTSFNPITEISPWQIAYADILRHYYADVEPPEEWIHWSFFLHDIDGDGVPELFIVYIQAGIWAESIYTFLDGEIVPIEGNFFAYYGIYAMEDRAGIIIQAYTQTDIMVLDGSELVTQTAFRSPFMLLDDYEIWHINGSEVTEDEFNEMYDALIPVGESRVNIWPYTINEENIRDVIFDGLEIPSSSHQISPYGREVAEEFLSGFASLFAGVAQAETTWDGARMVETGRWITGWDVESWEPIISDETPEIYRAPIETGIGFFDRQGNRIYDAPWLYIQHGENWVSYHYAGYFRLFEFDNSGIPVIFIHFNQTFEGGYGGFYRIFRYVDGEFRTLELRAFEDDVESPWAWLSRVHELFFDDTGKIITFASSEYHGIFRYEHLVFTDEHAEMHLVTALDNSDWDAWQEHHWGYWGELPDGKWGMLDGWLKHNPTIFGTDIALTPILPLVDLEEEMRESVLERRS